MQAKRLAGTMAGRQTIAIYVGSFSLAMLAMRKRFRLLYTGKPFD